MFDMFMPVIAAAGSGLGGMLVPMLIIFGIFYFMMIRPQQRKERERKKMIDEMRSGQRVLFSGGIVGTVSEAREHIFVIKIENLNQNLCI
jgi:preprotein translocase subunit YajC